jgi:hypothetical protein
MTIPQFTAGQVLTAAQLNAMVDAINAGGGMTEVTAFTASGTFTVPTGVTYAIAHIRAGGGGVGRDGSPGQGGTSSVAFAGGTVSATGGPSQLSRSSYGSNAQTSAGAANSGGGACLYSDTGVSGEAAVVTGRDGAYIVAGGAVTPAASITITVGAGGAAGGLGAAGGSGYVWIEYVKP